MFKIRIKEFEFNGDGNLELEREKEILCPDMKTVGEELKHYNHKFSYRRWNTQHWSSDNLADPDNDRTFKIAHLEREDGSDVCVDDPEMDEIGLRAEEFDGYYSYRRKKIRKK